MRCSGCTCSRPSTREKILADLANVAEHVSAGHGASVEAVIPRPGGYPVTVNDPALTARMLASLEAVAPGKVVEPPLVTGADDFWYFGREVPAMYFFVGATPPGKDPLAAPGNHSPEFMLDEAALDLGLRAMLQLTLGYLHGGS